MPFTPATGPAPSRARRATQASGPRSATRGLIDLCMRLREASSVHVTFLPKTRRLSATRTTCSAPTSNSTGKCGLRDVRRFPRRARLAQAQDDQARAARRAGQRHRDRLAHRRRPHRRASGTRSSLLHGDRLAQMGPALSHPRILFADRRDDGATSILLVMAGATAAPSPAPSISSAPTRCSAATGAPSSITRSCISRSATIRRSIMRSRTSWRGSRPARRASTSSRAATCR